MPSEILLSTSPSLSPIIWADPTDYSAGVWGTRTHALDLTSLAAGAYRQGQVADIGGADVPVAWNIFMGLEFATAPTARRSVEVYFNMTHSNTAFLANLTGSDGAYTGYSSDPDPSIFQLGPPLGIFSVVARATTIVQYAFCGVVNTRHRYITPVVRNNTDQALHSDAVEMFLALYPFTPESQ